MVRRCYRNRCTNDAETTIRWRNYIRTTLTDDACKKHSSGLDPYYAFVYPLIWKDD